MHQMDVTTAFLYAPLERIIYMKPREGTFEPGDEGKVLLGADAKDVPSKLVAMCTQAREWRNAG